MKPNSIKPKYRFLVLYNQTKSSHTALNNAVNLAKVVDARIDVLHVKHPTQIAKQDNQIGVMRTIEEEKIATKKKMQKLVSTIAESENISIISNYSFGNVTTEIQKHITNTKPDIVALGKRKNKIINFLGDGLTSYLLKNHKGCILISGNEKSYKPYNNVSLGFLEDISISNKIDIAEDLKKNSSKPFTLFKIKKSNDAPKKEPSVKLEAQTTETTVYEFDEGTRNSDSLTQYIKKNNVTILCIKRDQNKKSNQRISMTPNKIKQTIHKTNTTVLILPN